MDGLGVGRIVHVQDSGGRCRAAIVAEVVDGHEGVVNLTAFEADGQTAALTKVYPRRDGMVIRTWHWPERGGVGAPPWRA